MVDYGGFGAEDRGGIDVVSYGLWWHSGSGVELGDGSVWWVCLVFPAVVV